MDRIADDHDGLAREAAAGPGAGSLEGDRGKTITVRRIAPEGPEGKVAVEAGRLELHPRSALEVAREQPQRDAGPSGETSQELGNTRLENHRIRRQAAGEFLEVCLERNGEERAAPLLAHVLFDQLADDLRIRLAREIV